MMNKKDIFSLLDQSGNHDWYECGADYLFQEGPKWFDNHSGIDCELVDELDYNGDYGGDSEWRIFKFTLDSGETFFIKVFGWYRSYDGFNYQGWKEVSPAKKFVTVWE